MKGFNLTPSTSSLRAASELSSLKRSAKGFKKQCLNLNFHKNPILTPRRSHEDFSRTSTPLPPPTPASAHIPEFPYGDEVICISRKNTFDSDEISPRVAGSPSTSPYAPSYSSSSSSASSYHLPPELDDPLPSPVDEYNPRRGSELSMVSSWVNDHLQELDLSYDEDGVYEIEIVITEDGFPSRRDSFILPPRETFQSYRRNRNLPVVPAKQTSRLSRPLPCTPPASPCSNTQSRRFRPLPPPPSPS